MTDYLVGSGVLTQPWISSHAFDLALIGLMFGMFGAVALCVAAEKLIKVARRSASADLGDRLLVASNGDRTTADLIIANAEIGNDVLDREMSIGLKANRKEFDAVFHGNDGGERWQQVH